MRPGDGCELGRRRGRAGVAVGGETVVLVNGSAVAVG